MALSISISSYWNTPKMRVFIIYYSLLKSQLSKVFNCSASAVQLLPFYAELELP